MPFFIDNFYGLKTEQAPIWYLFKLSGSPDAGRGCCWARGLDGLNLTKDDQQGEREERVCWRPQTNFFVQSILAQISVKWSGFSSLLLLESWRSPSEKKIINNFFRK